MLNTWTSQLGLLTDTEGNVFLRNFGWLSTDNAALYPRRSNSST
jgi:hypothetical protein